MPYLLQLFYWKGNEVKWKSSILFKSATFTDLKQRVLIVKNQKGYLVIVMIVLYVLLPSFILTM